MRYGHRVLLTAAALLATLPGAAGLVGPDPLTLVFTADDRLEWNPGPFDRMWNLYRGDLATLRTSGIYTQQPGTAPLADAVCGRNAPWWEDPDLPPSGDAAFYLVSPVVTTVEEGPGEDSAGNPRPNDNPCTDGFFCVADLFDSFVMKVVDKEDLDHARSVVYGFGEVRTHVAGQVSLAPASWNPGWSFHVVPGTVSYWEQALEICDAAIAWVNVHGGPAPGGGWCPWWSEILYELPSPDHAEPDGIPGGACGPGVGH